MATPNRRAAAVGARTERRAWVLALAVTFAGARVAEASPLVDPPRAKKGPKIDDLYLRFTWFDQHGRGFQSKAGPPQGPGSQRLTVLQPQGMLTVRQADPRFSHQITFALDVISAASADGLDAVSAASRENEAGELDVTSTFASDKKGDWSLRYGVHFEEPLRSGFVGAGWVGRFADDNFTVGINKTFVFDAFDYIHPLGWSPKKLSHRYTLSDNITLSQILSPTTVLSGSYGLTFQYGQLATTWNSIYIADAKTSGCGDDATQLEEYDCNNRRPERLPKTRMRHAFALQLNQHIPKTRTTLKVSYRYYVDDFDLQAHTPGVMLYQWLGRRAYLRAMYRYHWQRGVSFYTVGTRMTVPEDTPLTADSDLAPFSAHQFGLKAVVYLTAVNSLRGAQYLDAGYSRYQRSNDLRVNVFSIGYGKDF